jgi:CheY-like chemotaxis protein
LPCKGAGYDVIEACDGKDALTKLDGQKVHLIISDVNMPNMDGITFVKEVKKMPSYKFTPVIMLTTDRQEQEAGRPGRRRQGLGGQALPAAADAGGRFQAGDVRARHAHAYRTTRPAAACTLDGELTVYVGRALRDGLLAALPPAATPRSRSTSPA